MGRNLNRFAESRKPRSRTGRRDGAPGRSGASNGGTVELAARQRPRAGGAKKAPPLRAGPVSPERGDCYFAGAFDVSVELLLCFLLLLLWCLLWLLWDLVVEAAGVDESLAGGSAARTCPAISARAMTGTSFLNIDVVSR